MIPLTADVLAIVNKRERNLWTDGTDIELDFELMCADTLTELGQFFGLLQQPSQQQVTICP